MFASFLSACRVQYISFSCFSLIVKITLYVYKSLQKIMEPCRDIHIEYDSVANRQSCVFQQPDRKYFQSYCDGRFTNYTHKSFLTFHSPESVLLFTIIMASPEALLELNNGCTAEKITRKQHYNRDVNMRRVNRSRADTSA